MGLIKAIGSTRCYDIHGLMLALHCREEILMERAESLLAPFFFDRSEPPVCHAHMAYAMVPASCEPPPGMTFFGKGSLVKGVDQYCWTSERNRYLFVPETYSVAIDHDTGSASIQVTPGKEWAVPIGVVVPVVAEFLREHGQHIIHSAVLTTTRDGEEKAVLITGESGRGKSSTALAFAGAGFKLYADDTAFLSADGNRLAVWGLSLACKVHHHTLRLLPWLDELPKGPELVDDEVSMDLCKAFGPGATARACPEVVVFLHERNPDCHIITPLDKFTALKLFADDNLRRLDARGHGHSGDAFRLFGRLVADCLTLRVSAGPDLAGLPAAILHYLGWEVADD